jgi:hypothetical protein
MRWISADRFAALADVSLRAAQKALARALAAKPWNGHRLEVRVVRSRGGAAGAAYEVAVASLPPDIAAKLAPVAAPSSRPAKPASAADWRLRLVLSVIEAGPPGSRERAAKLRAVAAYATFPTGAKAGQPIAERTLRKWCESLEAREAGPGAVRLLPAARKRRADAGLSRVIAWREWDRAMTAAGVPEERQREIAGALHREVKGLWKAGEASAANIAFSMAPRCRDFLEEAGVVLPEDAMVNLCRMPVHFAERSDRRRASVAHVKRSDAAGWAARHVPRVRRHREGMRPMDLVAADVRHSDILYRRPDGTAATVKVVCFLDLATNRLFSRPFMLPRGEMIRREHVLTALRDLAADPSWGLFRGLYLDNGGEFSLGAAPDDLAQLADDYARAIHGREAATRAGIIAGLPHNPQSKVIEAIFSAITRSIEPVYPGFIGGNRMAKKTQNQGRAPVPMEGDEAAIVARYAEMTRFYNAKPQQSGAIKGRSPNEALAAFINDAAKPWRAITLDPGEFSLCFGPDVQRKVQPGGELHINGRVFAHPDLAARVGEAVPVRVPILAPGFAVVLSDKGRPEIVATEAPSFAFTDRAGARAHHAGRKAAGAAAARAAGDAAKVDPVAMRRRAVAALPSPIPPAPETASIDPVLREAAGDFTPAPIRPRAEVKRAERVASEAEAVRLYNEALRRAG